MLEEFERPVGQQPFGGDVDEFQFAAADLLGDDATLARREGTVDRRGRDAARLEGVDLVLHQRDERRHDQREPFATDGGGLIAEAFAAAGGKDDDRVLPGHGGAHRFGL